MYLRLLENDMKRVGSHIRLLFFSEAAQVIGIQKD